MSHNSKSLKKSNQILVSNTFAFTMSFMVWLMYGSLIKFLTTPIVIDSTLLEKGIFPHLTEWKFLILFLSRESGYFHLCTFVFI